MAQKLILPINNTRITAGYKNPNYKKEFGYNHYGMDLTDKDRKDTTIWGSGVGEVVEAGWSDSGGNVVVIAYKNCELPNGSVKDLVMRYYHLDSIKVSKGQKITKDTRIGVYGNTGASSGAHLHIEIDTDTKYPENLSLVPIQRSTRRMCYGVKLLHPIINLLLDRHRLIVILMTT